LSHIASYKTKIKVNASCETRTAREQDPTWRLLRQAVETAAQDLGGRVTEEITDYYGQRTQVVYGVQTPQWARGVGVKVSPVGAVTFIYDPYDDYRREARKIAETISQNYATLAVAQALRTLNYEVEMDRSAETPAGTRTVLVRGVL
jgi:hypothetical protein